MTFKQIYQLLYEYYGPQNWWPAESTFEVMVGAVLTQNTAWVNVELAISNLKQKNCLSAEQILKVPENKLAGWLRPSGYFNIKAKRLHNLSHWYVNKGKYDGVKRINTDELRESLLSVNGVGPETADDILLYAFERPVFVIDVYTRRLFGRLGLIEEGQGYEQLRSIFEESLPRNPALFNEYHALIVIHAKEVCKKKPVCSSCCLSASCLFYGGHVRC